MVKNYLANLDKEKELEDNAKFMIPMYSLFNLDVSYMNMKQIAQGKKDDVFCNVDINSE
jgi:hypothetical protein